MKPDVRRTILGGFSGTVLMTLMMYLVSPMMTGHRMDIAASLASMMGANWYVGMMAHAFIGVLILPLVFSSILYPILPGAPWLKGLSWGLLLWLVAQVLISPMMGAGLFSSQMGGMPAAISSLIGHAVYGGTLGLFAGGPASKEARGTA